MKKMSGKKSIIVLSTLILALLMKVCPAEAARRFTVTELGAQPVLVTMGDPAGTTLTYSIANTSTGVDQSKGIYRLIFTAPAGYTFTGASALPAGWAISGTPGVSITLLTSNNPCTNCILYGTPQSFTLRLGAIPAGTQDTVGTVSVQARFNNNKNTTDSGQTFVTVRSLKAALVAYVSSQCTPDCTNWGSTCSATPSIAVTGTHSLALIVQNKSTSTWTGVISNPNPPTAVYTWAGGAPAFNTPASLTLAPGACGVVVWTVTMPGKTGLVYYQAQARNSTGAATSIQVTSNTVVVASPAAGLSQTCVFPGETTTVTMSVQNNGSITLTNLRPWGSWTALSVSILSSATTVNANSTAGFPPSGLIRIDSEEISYTGTTVTSFTGCARGADSTIAAPHSSGAGVSQPRPFFIGTAAPTYLSGPTPASIASLAPFANSSITWTYRMDGNGGQTYSFQGFVSAAGAGITSPVVSSPMGSLGYFNVTIGSGATLGAGTFNNETTWNMTNNGCTPATVNIVAIQVPGGFMVLNNGFDSDTGVDPPDWNAAYAGGTVSFTAGTNMAVGQSGAFSILFSGLPGTGGYSFPVTVTDTAGHVVTVPTTVTVDTSLPGSGANEFWEEPTR